MKIEIDQSGKVEYTATHTIVGDSLGNSFLLKAQDKRKLLQFYRLIGKPRIFAFEVFAIITAYLIQLSFRSEHQYIIDREYIGKENDIKRFLLLSLSDLHIPIYKDQIHFGLISKKSKAHKTAYYEYIKPTKSYIMTTKKIIRLIHP
ncbi:MAG TPA: hypothetical protein PLS49_07575 [Candidatus Woesebacteria bacterium]|nr:hypothetical protein [Candidatus Woesebacteria bacterium]